MQFLHIRDYLIMEENVKKFKLIFWPIQEYQHIPSEFDVKTREIVEVCFFYFFNPFTFH